MLTNSITWNWLHRRSWATTDGLFDAPFPPTLPELLRRSLLLPRLLPRLLRRRSPPKSGARRLDAWP